MNALRLENSTTYFPGANGLGTPRVWVGVDGSVAETCVNLPFGGGQRCSGTADPSPAHFTGLQYDSETGNSHALFRDYNSTLGRWMTPDPLAGDITNPQSLNRYAYVLNNPATFTDPLGLSCSDPSDGKPCVVVVTAQDPCSEASVYYYAGCPAPNPVNYPTGITGPGNVGGGGGGRKRSPFKRCGFSTAWHGIEMPSVSRRIEAAAFVSFQPIFLHQSASAP